MYGERSKLDGETGVCISYSFKIDGLMLALRVGDRIVVVRHSDVRIHPDEMQSLQEELTQLIEFNKRHDTELGRDKLDG